MSDYLDTNVLLSFFLTVANSDAAEAYFRRLSHPPVISDWAAAEFVDNIRRKGRNGEFNDRLVSDLLRTFSDWRETKYRKLN